MRSCAGRSIPKGAVRHREPPPPRRRSLEGPSFHVYSSSTDEPTSERRAERRIGSGGAANRQRRAAEATAVRSERGHRCTAAVFDRAEHPAPVGARKRTPKPKSLRHSSSGEPIRALLERSASDSLDCSLSTRAAEVESVGVNAAAKTTSRPGIWICVRQMRPSLRGVGRNLDLRQPPG